MWFWSWIICLSIQLKMELNYYSLFLQFHLIMLVTTHTLCNSPSCLTQSTNNSYFLMLSYLWDKEGLGNKSDLMLSSGNINKYSRLIWYFQWSYPEYSINRPVLLRISLFGPDVFLITSLCKHDAFVGCFISCCCLCLIDLKPRACFCLGPLGRGDGDKKQPRCGNWDVLSSTEGGHSESMCGVHAAF